MNCHFAVPVKDLSDSEEFYKKLGFKKINEWNKPSQKRRGILFGKENLKIELIYHESSNLNIVWPDIVEAVHIGYEVKNLDKLIQNLKNEGVEVVRPVTKGVSVKQFAFIRDPNGFPIELFEAKEKSE